MVFGSFAMVKEDEDLEEDEELEIKGGQNQVQHAIAKQAKLIHFSKCNCRTP